MIHRWKAKNLLFPTMCCNINLVKPFGNNALLNTRSTAENLRSRRDHNLSAQNQYYRPSGISYNIESQSYVKTTFLIQKLRHFLLFVTHKLISYIYLLTFTNYFSLQIHVLKLTNQIIKLFVD